MNRCIPCGYDLAGRAAGERCPECGAPVPPMDLGGAWNDAVVRRRFAIGAWLFMAVVPSVLPGVLVSWQADVRAGVVMAIGVRPLLALAAAIALLCSACLGTHFTLRRRFGGTG